MPAASFILALASLAVAGPEHQPSSSRPVLVAQADGGWSITEKIPENGPTLAVATEGLLVDEEEWAEAQWAERERRELDEDEAYRRGFEEAVDAARREPQP